MILVAIPIALFSYLLFRALTLEGKLKPFKYAKFIPSTIVISFAIILYFEINPTDSYYIQIFSDYLGYDLPRSAVIVHKEESKADLQGEAYASVTVKLDEKTYESFKGKINSDTLFRGPWTSLNRPKEFDHTSTYYKFLRKTKENLYVTFSDNNNRVTLNWDNMKKFVEQNGCPPK